MHDAEFNSPSVNLRPKPIQPKTRCKTAGLFVVIGLIERGGVKCLTDRGPQASIAGAVKTDPTGLARLLETESVSGLPAAARVKR